MCAVNNENGKEIVRLYEDGMKLADISRMYEGVYTFNAIRYYLTLKGIYKVRKFHGQLTYEQCVEIGELYRVGNYDEIFNIHPNLSMSTVRAICQKLGVKRDGYFWSKNDVQYLIDNYGVIPTNSIVNYFNGKFTKSAILTKARKIGLRTRNYWSEEENRILQEYYSAIPIQELMKLLPDRTKEAIVCRAKKYKLKSFQKIQEHYTDDQIQYVIDNWQRITDVEIAKEFGRTPHGIRDLRARLGLCRFNKEYSKYSDIIALFRGHISEWKSMSAKSCNYECVLTGSKDFEIHHLYGFNMIVAEAFDIIKKEIKLISIDIEDYTKEELDRMIEIFLEVHSKYPLGVCVEVDLHKLFHLIYGAGGNTPEQWETFVENYKNGNYNDLLS